MESIVKINGTDYKVKNTLRSIFIFEEITGKSFEIKTMRDNYVFLYSVILACNSENILSWDEFIDALDNDPSILAKLNDLLAKANEVEKLLSEEGGEDETGKKKE